MIRLHLTTVLDLGLSVWDLGFRAFLEEHMGGCQNYGPFLGTLNIRGRIIIGIPKRDHNFDNHPYN